MEDTGIVHSMKDFYWDIRPKPEYGTIELRVCDTPLTVERAAAIAVYLQALCSSILAGEEPDPLEDDYLVYTYNRFQACRFGLDGLIVNPRRTPRISARRHHSHPRPPRRAGGGTRQCRRTGLAAPDGQRRRQRRKPAACRACAITQPARRGG
jgi:hypothetical protein